MRLAWNTSVKKNDYDFFLWLNDDTILDPNALLELFKTYTIATSFEQSEVIITAACRSDFNNDVFSYGGKNEKGPVIPNGKIQSCKFINGNAVLIPDAIYRKLGYLSNAYTHGIGDYDYGLRAISAGFKNYTTLYYIATCPNNEEIPTWCNPSVSVLKRWETFHSPRGLNIKEYILFRKKFWKERWVIYIFKAYAKMIIPNLYNKISRIK
jgi:GT2 family glycosyltransferase